MEIKKYQLGPFVTNTYIITRDGNSIIIDPTLNLGCVIDEIKTKYNIKAVLISHAHIDHIDGIRYFLDLPIYISSSEIDILSNSHYNLYQEFYYTDTPFDVSKLKLIPFKDSDELNIFGFNIKTMLTPGHTKGSAIFEIDNNLFTGDTLFLDSIGRWDFPSGNYLELKESIKKIINKYNDIICYPGHGDIFNIKLCKKENEFVKEIIYESSIS